LCYKLCNKCIREDIESSPTSLMLHYYGQAQRPAPTILNISFYRTSRAPSPTVYGCNIIIWTEKWWNFSHYILEENIKRDVEDASTTGGHRAPPLRYLILDKIILNEKFSFIAFKNLIYLRWKIFCIFRKNQPDVDFRNIWAMDGEYVPIVKSEYFE